MSPKLTTEMREALRRDPGQLVTVEDDETHDRYVLLPLRLFERLRSILAEDELTVSESYAAQSAAAGAAGWDDSDMDVYDNYDANRPKS